jgi:hypothetical protein
MGMLKRALQKVKSHLYGDLRLYTEVVRIIKEGSITSSQSPLFSTLGAREQWGIKHLEECAECRSMVYKSLETSRQLSDLGSSSSLADYLKQNRRVL